MTVFPRQAFVRVVATLWLLAAMAMLLITLLRSGIGLDERSALSTLVPLYFMSLPSGHLAVLALSKAKIELYVSSGLTISIFYEGLALWTALTVLGYLQWFVLLPSIARGARHLTDHFCTRFLAR
jgi:hypothetical protein